MPARTGQMRELVKFQRRTASADGYGNTLSVFADLYGPVYARLRPLKGVEQSVDGRLSGVSDFEVTVRWTAALAGVTTEDRIIHARTGVTYNIVATQNPDERNAQLSFIVKSGTSEGL